MTRHVSSSSRGWSRKLCLVVLLMFALVSHLQITVHGKGDKGGSPKKNPKKDDKKTDDKKVKKGFVDITKKKDKNKNKNKNKDKDKDKDKKKNKDKDKDKDKNKNKNKDKDKDKKKDNKKRKWAATQMKVDQEKQVHEVITEYDYDLQFPTIYNEVSEELIMKTFKKTYNSMFTELVILSAEATFVDTFVESPRNLRNLVQRSSRFRLASMRARAAGPNALARRPLFRSNTRCTGCRRVLVGPSEALGRETDLQVEVDFFNEFAINLLAAAGIAYKGDSADTDILHTFLHATLSDKNAHENFYSFKTRMVLKNVNKTVDDETKQELRNDFQLAYNEMFWDPTEDMNSLVVNVPQMGQNLKDRPNGNTDLICIFKGTMYAYSSNGTVNEFEKFIMPKRDTHDGTHWQQIELSKWYERMTDTEKKTVRNQRMRLNRFMDKRLVISSRAGKLPGVDGGD